MKMKGVVVALASGALVMSMLAGCSKTEQTTVPGASAPGAEGTAGAPGAPGAPGASMGNATSASGK